MTTVHEIRTIVPAHAPGRRLQAAANRVRLRHGLPPLEWHDSLAASALRHAQDLVAHGRFSHTGTDGSDVVDRVRRESSKWRGVGENLAIGQCSVQEVVDGWLESPGHRANLLRSGFTHAGAAVLHPDDASPYRLGFLSVQVYGVAMGWSVCVPAFLRRR